jgi:Uncharacterized MobA-related protein
MLDCVLLAAGASSRMEAASIKPLLPLAGSTLVELAAAAALDAGCRLLLVVGREGGEVASRFESPSYAAQRAGGRIVLVENPRWREGMIGSIQAALPRVEGGAFFVAHADMPFVGPGAYRALEEAWSLRSARVARGAALSPPAAFFASHGGREGHPVLLPSAWIPEMLGLGPGERLRPFLEGRPRELVEAGEGALRDIDTLGEYEKALRDAAEGMILR